jgi:putative peptide zinc metalloprotease protein
LGMHWAEFSDGMLDRVFSVENLLLAWFVFPLLKIAHEMGHALAVKVRGGEVHEMGVMLLLLMPIPYVDASSAAAFADKRWRMMTGAAGMLVELFIAAVAILVWVYLEPGTGRAIAYNIVLIAGISTIVFNGNPLLRFDGYYILADYIEIPNLGQRANEYWMYLLNQYVFRVEGYPKPVRAQGEAGWFLGYGFASFCYRIFMTVTIVWLVIGKYFLLGILLAAWSVANTVIQPLFKGLKYLLTSNRLAQRRLRAGVSVLAGVALAWLLLFGLAAPSYTVSEGVVWAPEESQVRSSVDCFITEVKARPGEKVSVGAALLGCEDPELLMRAAVLESELQGLEARYRSVRVSNQVQAEILSNQIAHARVALNLARAHIGSLQVRSPIAGTFQIVDPQDLSGRYIQRGELLGYVTTNAATIVRVVVPQRAADKVRKGALRVLARPVKSVGTEFEGRLLRGVPRATNQLPSLVLSTRGGGKIPLDPEKPDEPVSLEKIFVFDVQLQDEVRLKELGSRVYVRFEHAAEPIGYQWMRILQGAFMKKIDV